MVADIVISRDFVTADVLNVEPIEAANAGARRSVARPASYRYTFVRDPREIAQQARLRAWALRGHMMLDGLILTASLLGGTCIAAQLVKWCCA